MVYSLGKVSYINSLPLFCAPLPNDFKIVDAVPSALNEMAGMSRLDATLISRWIYPHIQRNYSVVKNFCIAGDGEIMSVKLFSKKEISELGNSKIFITSQTGTSSRAFRFLCAKKYGFDIFANRTEDFGVADSAIFIGNQAMAIDPQKSGFNFVYDLGQMWKEIVGLPMIYAVFVVKNHLKNEVESKLREYLEMSLNYFDTHKESCYRTAASMFEKSQSKEISALTLQKYYNRLIFNLDDLTFEKSFNFVSENGCI